MANPERMHLGLRVLGLTGNIACGKTTVAGMLAALGARVIEADAIVHQLYLAGTPTFNALVRRFGDRVAGNEGIDRAALGQIAFADSSAMADLEAIVHPAVAKEVRKRLEDRGFEPAAVIEAIKLVESESVHLLDALWIVTAPRPTQLERLVATRRLSEAEAVARIDSQSPPEAKLRRFNDCCPGKPVTLIPNDGDLAALRDRVRSEWRRFLDLPAYPLRSSTRE